MSRPSGTARPLRVGLLGMYASANLGDTAIQTAVMAALRARMGDVAFTAICTDPEDACRTFGIRARHVGGFGAEHHPGRMAADAGPRPRGPLPWQLAETAWRVRRHMAGLDALLVSGSGQIDDFWGGPWEQPFRLLAWSAAARGQGKPVACFGVGVDQLLTRTGTWLALQALNRADLRVLRDPGSLQALHALGFAGACQVSPDPAFALDTTAARQRRREPPPRFAVISPISRKAWPGPQDERYEAYLQAMAAAADHLQRRGVAVRFVCSQTRMDPPVVAHIRARMQGDAESAHAIDVSSVDDYLVAVDGALFVLGARLHALILALVMGTPVIAVSYARKVRQQMEDAGLGPTCFDLPAVEIPALLAAVDNVIDRNDEMRAQVRATSSRFRADLGAQFDRLAAVLTA